MEELVRRSGLRGSPVHIACTRGAPPLPGSRDPLACRSIFLAHVQPLVLRGLAIRTSPDMRRIPAGSVDPGCRNVHGGDVTRALLAAREQGFGIAVVTGHAGPVAEGPGFDIIALAAGDLVTPDADVPGGASCRTMMELTAASGIPARRGRLAPELLRDAEEAFITSTSCGLMPATRVDGRIPGNGAPGPVATRLLNLYYRRKDEGCQMTPIPGL